MNPRQRFLATMHYQPRDRSPICDFGFWDETIIEWHQQGLPAHVTGGGDTSQTDPFFGMESYGGGPGVHVGMLPGFEYKVIEDRGEYELVQQADGVRVLRQKYMGSIPHHEGHLLVDRESWNKHYKPRLDPATPARLPGGGAGPEWENAVRIWKDPNRTHCCSLWGGSLFGWLRDWMGLENISMVPYDDPAWFEEMVTTLADCSYATLSRALETGGQFDGCAFWEDMCYNAGPLLSPDHFKQYLVPHYRRLSDLLRKHGVDVIWLDCDGKIDDLLPMWLDAGINCMFPLEIGTWGADPIKYRKQYGKGLLMMGGFDKHILAQTKPNIEAEVRRLSPLVEEGGFIGFCDHRVPPDVSLDNYLHYLRLVRKYWGKDLPNLLPMGQIRV